ncbi:ATP-binding protein [Rhizobium sp. SGZ-381]|uniref:ATP-binding protein n=1 Tax=Rhizobium sp. SGZ-381 TaxID=3342800 RepID=UPI003672E42E
MTPSDLDLEACAREPIRVPGAIQPHGALFVLRPQDQVVVQVSANLSDYLQDDVVLGQCPSAALEATMTALLNWHAGRQAFFQTRLAGQGLTLLAHRAGPLIVCEVEPGGPEQMDEVFGQLRSFVQKLSDETDISRSLVLMTQFIAELTGFDRVLLYRFDEEWNGQVVAESGNGRLPSYLGLRFPASDIPAQARALYASNRLRIIPDVNYTAVPLVPPHNPQTGEPLDMSFAQLRSVSPVHLEYMRNMGTGASMSVSIMIDGGLWGLISCHSAGAHTVSHALRETCDFAAQTLAMRIGSLARAEDAARRVELSQVTTRLLSAMSAENDWLDGLVSQGEGLLEQVTATGACVITPTELRSFGITPAEEDLRRLVSFLEARPEGRDLFATQSLAADYPAGEAFGAIASGVLAIGISELHASWLIWFRPELVRTVQWGGNPHKRVGESGRIHPRKSFDAWRELVRLQAEPWNEAELAAARNLRAAIVGVVLRKAEEMAQLSSDLQRSNKELEAFSYSVSHDLRAPFRHIVGFAELLRERETTLDDKSRHYLQTISEAAISAGRLVDDLLSFSQLGRASIVPKPMDMNKLVADVIKSVSLGNGGRRIEWSVSDLPPALGDVTLIRQVWFNLIDNAVKYTQPRSVATIAIRGYVRDEMTIYSVSDNGVGFDMAYVGKLFGVFQRLQRAEDFEGTGIGLALVRRIIERHNGSIEAEGEVDEGATFTFYLPNEMRKGRAIA